MSAVTASALSPAQPAQRDPDLWHISLNTAPDRAYCGSKLDVSKWRAGHDAPGPMCVVCEELAAAYIAGRWTP